MTGQINAALQSAGSIGVDPRANACAGRPEYTYETAARAWAQAKERVDCARDVLRRAELEAQEAAQAEEAAWQILLEKSGRVPKSLRNEPGCPPPLRGSR